MPEALESTPTTRTSQGILQTHTRTTLAKKTPRKKPIKIIKSKAVFSYESVIFAIEVVIWNNGNNCNSNKSATTVQQHGLSQCTKQPPTNSNGKLHNANSILFPSLCPPPVLRRRPFSFSLFVAVLLYAAGNDTCDSLTHSTQTLALNLCRFDCRMPS